MMKKFFWGLVLVLVASFTYFSFRNNIPLSIKLTGSKVLSTTLPMVSLFMFLLGAFLTFVYFSGVLLSRSRGFARELKEIRRSLKGSEEVAGAFLDSVLGSHEDAISKFKNIEGVPQDKLKLYEAVLRFRAGEDVSKELEELRIKGGYSREVYLAEALCILEIGGDTKRAVELLEKVLEEEGESRFVLEKLRDACIKSRDWERAKTYGRLLVKLDPSEDNKNILVGVEYELLKIELNADPKAVEKKARKLIKSNKEFLPLYFVLAKAYESMGKEDKEKKLFEELVRERPDPATLKFIEDYYMRKGDPDTALDFYRKALAVSQNKPELLLFYGSLCEHVELLDEAFDAYARLENKGFKNPYLSVRKAFLLKRMGREKEAMESFEKIAFEVESSFKPRFRCTRCGGVSEEWRDFCENCELWNTYSLTL